MGALHDGHRSLLRHAAALAAPDGAAVVSIFVNPRQFGPAEDLDRYPRTLGADLALCAADGVAVVFAPSAAEMYPAEPVVTVDPGPMGQLLEGEFRPGFFSGVLTVVLKLFGLVRPDIAVFGEKDAQQLALVRRMSADLNLGVQIASVPTFRDDDGLATSSRNRYLSAAERRVALTLPAALQAGRAAGRRRPPGGRRRGQEEAGPGGRGAGSGGRDRRARGRPRTGGAAGRRLPRPGRSAHVQAGAAPLRRPGGPRGRRTGRRYAPHRQCPGRVRLTQARVRHQRRGTRCCWRSMWATPTRCSVSSTARK